MEALTYEQARVKLAVQHELAYARELMDCVTLNAGETTAHATIRRILTHGEIRPRVDDTPVEVELVRRAKEGDELAYFRMMFAYAEFLRGVAKRAYRHAGMHDDDVTEAIALTFAAAVDGYNPARGAKLSAALKMHGNELLSDVLNPTTRVFSRTIDSRLLRRYYATMDEAKERVATIENCDPESVSYQDALPFALEITTAKHAVDPKHEPSAEAYMAIYDNFASDVRLDDAPRNCEDGARSNHEIYATPARFVPGVEDEVVDRMDSEAQTNKNKELTARALSVLDEFELEVVLLYYGFPPASYRPMKDAEVAEELKETRGYSRVKVNRLRRRALDKMKIELGVKEGE